MIGIVHRTNGGEPCCAQCGCHESCQKVCRLVCEEKKVEVVCWGAKCEKFCVPGPSKPTCKHKDSVCECEDSGCGKDEVIPTPRKLIWFEWRPKGCGKILSKTKLMKKVETKTVPSYKWVVEDLCPECQARQSARNPSRDVAPVVLSDDSRSP